MWRWTALGDCRVRGVGSYKREKDLETCTDSGGKCPGSYKQSNNTLSIFLSFFLCPEGHFEGQISSVGPNQHFPQGWGKWKVNGGMRLAWAPPSQLQREPKKETKEARLEISLGLLFLSLLPLGPEDLECKGAGPWDVLGLPESPVCIEAEWSFWSLHSGFYVKTETRTSPHLIKVMCLFGFVQVSCVVQGPKLKLPVRQGCCTQILVNSYLLNTQYSLGICTSVCFQNCSPQQRCEIWFILWKKSNLDELSG